ncbi:hypothetical protein GOV07_05315 [Candidatus Woesearchaeota archaeon]|nr:hypothetical protein [Candidatus Woesearchaeota archaeon]
MDKEKKLPTLKEDLEKELLACGFEQTKSLMEEFELLTINEETPSIAREMAKKVKDRVAGFAQLLEELLQPDSGLAAMNECSFFTEAEIEQVAKSYRELMSVLRQFTMADIEANEEAYRRFLKSAIPRWEAKKDWLRTIISKLHSDWKKEQPLQGERGYFG